MELKQIFINLVQSNCTNKTPATKLWNELQGLYTDKGRHYHNLKHLENMYTQLLEVRHQITDWDTIIFSLFYHDAIYSVRRNDNEENSAALAVKRLSEIEYPENKIQLCATQILATKKHEMSNDNDTNLLTDADLSILGTTPEHYKAYTNAIRKEYSIYPDILYKPGRKKALSHFLEMEYIYKTPHFRDNYESAARANILWELGKF